MILPVRRGHGALPAFCALLIFLARGAASADNLNGAAQELAWKTASFAGKGAPVSIAWRNQSSLASAEAARARTVFEAAFREAGGVLGETAPAVEVRITVSENPTDYLLVEEARKGDQRLVWLSAWMRTDPLPASSPAATLEKRLVFEQDEQILDAVFPGDLMLVLSPARLAWFARQNGQWAQSATVPLPVPKAWPRDVRGRLRVSGPGFHAYLPGVACSGAWQPPVAVDCQPSQEPWVLESGSHAMLLANFAAGRNFFDGRVATQTGVRKSAPPFYSAAAVEERGKTLWLLALAEGRARLFDASFEPAGEIDFWGSDVAGMDVPCAGGSAVLATRPGDGGQPDAVQAFTIANGAAAALTTPVEMPGPVTALWVSTGTSALAVSKSLSTGKYAAYLLTVACGQ
jgi:hypothetical protein